MQRRLLLKKQTVNASQDRYKIPSCWNNLFQGEQIVYLRQTDSASRLYAKEFFFDKSSRVKQTIYQKLCNSNENTFSFIPHVYYFPYHPSIAAFEAWGLTTLFSTKVRGVSGGEWRAQSQEHQHLCLSNLW